MMSNAKVFHILSYVWNSFYSYRKTVHQFYLQLRQDILNDQLYCHEEASFVLGGLALQAETGDHNEALGDEYFLPEHYIPSKVKLFSLVALIFVMKLILATMANLHVNLPSFKIMCILCDAFMFIVNGHLVVVWKLTSLPSHACCFGSSGIPLQLLWGRNRWRSPKKICIGGYDKCYSEMKQERWLWQLLQAGISTCSRE